VTERVGALEDRFLGRGRPLGEARVLWEIGQAGSDVRDLRRRLSLDSGYLSRLLRSLERQGLVTTGRATADRRVRRATLTAAGLAEWHELERRSDELARALLEPLGERQRSALVEAMAEVERLLLPSLVRIAVEDPASRDARWCLARYYEELDDRFDAGFDPDRSISADARELTPPAGALLVARVRDEPVGCGALKLRPDGSAELKRMWVATDARGLGLGRRLLGELEAYARAAGATTIRLETNRTLGEAIALYRRSGYCEVAAFNDEPYAHHWFEKRLPDRTENPARAGLFEAAPRRAVVANRSRR
jgi:DNA-binding MarR family transcriptional regulator/GNAT superfamily N-acetyltransferase